NTGVLRCRVNPSTPSRSLHPLQSMSSSPAGIGELPRHSSATRRPRAYRQAPCVCPAPVQTEDVVRRTETAFARPLRPPLPSSLPCFALGLNHFGSKDPPTRTGGHPPGRNSRCPTSRAERPSALSHARSRLARPP